MTTDERVHSEPLPRPVRGQLRARLMVAEQLAVTSTIQALLADALVDLSRLPRSQLVRCAKCSRRGLPERIAIHDCPIHPTPGHRNEKLGND